MDFISTIDEWRRVTETGDRAELSGLEEDSSLWHDVSAQAETCLGNDCPQYRECYVTTMRQRAAESDLVIVNHHLLCADASVRQSTYGEVIPDCHHAIIDEAHHLEDVATQYFGIAVSNYRISDLVRDSERALNLGMIEDFDSDLRHAITRVDDHSLTFFGALQTARHARGGFEERLRIGPGWFGDVLDDGLGLIAALGGLDDAMRKKRRQRRSRRAGERRRRDAGAPRRGIARPPDVPARSGEPVVRLFPRDAQSRRVPARRADRRVAHHQRDALQPDARDDHDVRDADGGGVVRLRQGPPRRVRRRLRPRAIGIRLQRAGHPLSAEADAAAQIAAVRRGGGARSPRPADQDGRPRVRAVHELRDAAHGPRSRRARSALPGDRAGHGAAQHAARAIPIDARTRCCLRPRPSGRASMSSANS